MPRSTSVNPLRIGVVGVGMAGQSHLLDAVTAPGVDVVAVCSRRFEHANEVASKFGIRRAYDDLQEMLDSEALDAAVVATPHRVLAAHVTQCLQSGINVVAEKPLGVTSEEVFAIREAARRTGGQIAVAYTRRYRSAWAEARSWIASGQIGEVEKLTCTWQGPYRERFSPRSATFLSDPAQRADGVVMDSGCHVLDAVLFLTGNIGVVLQVRLTKEPSSDAHVEGCVQICQPGDCSVSITFRDCPGSETHEVIVYGKRGHIMVDADGRAVAVRHNREIHSAEDRFLGRPVDDLVALAEGRPTLGASVEDAGAVVAAIEQICRQSTQSQLPPWRRPRAKALARLSGGC
jgi:UDP-N-acetylglucosamine 3-dehydrogenase